MDTEQLEQMKQARSLLWDAHLILSKLSQDDIAKQAKYHIEESVTEIFDILINHLAVVSCNLDGGVSQ